ncbi:MAG: hypothetical protein H6736_03000 [Alphaproteobacteria bacterium]|nr:hypothetical protein [Alphaproteobacteria bacterium]MCB9690762.1 hypothetical protein [Alphaproteobacteria bacterium]
MIALLLALSAWACPPTSGEVARARAAYDDAEVEEAAAIVDAALTQLGCQTTVVDRETLLDLYRLDALVALARAEDREAVEATMRAVTVDPLATPPATYGPELVDLHRSWAGRMSDKRVEVGVLGGGTVYIDGEPIRHGQRMTVVKGHHLVQIDGQGGLTSVVDVLNGDRSVVTGLPSPEPEPRPKPVDAPPVPAPKPVPQRWRPVALWAVGGGLAAVGAGAVALAARQEKAFKVGTFEDPDAVDAAAVRIRVLYITGYAMAGAGTVTLGTNVVGLNRRKR